MNRFSRKLLLERNKRARVLKQIRVARDEASTHKRSKAVWTLKSVLKEIPYQKPQKMSSYNKTKAIYVNMRFNPRVLKQVAKKQREVLAKK